MSKPHNVVILGAGPAGVGAAYRLRQKNKAAVTVIEQRGVVGGNAGSFEACGQRLDYGSHRLHPACDPEILADIRALMGDDLLDRPRHGRILLRGRWIHFPLQPLDLLLRLDRRFALETVRDMVVQAVRRRSDSNGDTFTSVLRSSLGPTICQHFYFPYAKKIWGREPDDLSSVQARRRVSAGSFGKLMRKVLSQVPGFKSRGGGRFFYPRRGYGQISEAYADGARAAGAEILLGWKVRSVEQSGANDGRWTVVVECDGQRRALRSDYVWSTIPISLLANMIMPAAPARVLEASRSLEYRAMLLVYLQLGVERFSEYDAHYFPDAAISITRLSEPKNYSASTHPRGQTILCAELPCSPTDPCWTMNDADLALKVADDLARAAIPLPSPPIAVHVQRLRQAYPIYACGYEPHFTVLDEWVESLPRLLSYGRQGLFAHDNTHHALFMAYAAAECLNAAGFDGQKWRDYRRVFETHVVED